LATLPRSTLHTSFASEKLLNPSKQVYPFFKHNMIFQKV
jgi:hypothetical protein